MKFWITLFGRVIAVSLPLALGGIVIVYSGTLISTAAPKETVQQPTPVRVITMAEVDLVPRVTGYGIVAPAREWRAVARIEGEVIETSPLFG